MIARRIPTAIHWLLIYALISALLQLEMSQFIYQRDVMQSEPWRWWTAQWVHVGWRHYLLNILALACLPFIFPQFNRTNLLWAILVLSPLVSVGLYWYVPDVYAYAGLSGVLHGLYAAAALDMLRHSKPAEHLAITAEQKFAGLILVGIVLKVLIERLVGHTNTEKLIQAPVLIQAHQLGLVAGLMYGSLKYCWLKIRRFRYSGGSAEQENQ